MSNIDEYFVLFYLLLKSQISNSYQTVRIYTFQLNQISRRSLTISMESYKEFTQTAQASYQKKTNTFLCFRSKPPIESAKTIPFESSFSKPLKFQRSNMKANNFQEKLASKNNKNYIRSMQTSMDEESTELASMKSSSIIKSVKFMFENEKNGNVQPSTCSRNEGRSSILKRKSLEKNTSEKSNGFSINSYKKPIVNSLHLKGIKSEGIVNQNDKYCQLYERLKQSKTKYSDQLFPPGATTLSYSANYRQMFKDIKWVRIQEMFPYSMKATLKAKQTQDQLQNIIMPGVFHQFRYMIDCFNSLSGNRKSLEILFENQQINKEGIYYVRVFHEGIWKYIIIDDYIPVMKKDNRPAFIDVLQNQKIQVWPFLLQKAFAKIYSCYQFLIPIESQIQYIAEFNLNFLQQMTGIVPRSISTSNSSFTMELQNAFIDEDSVFLARKDKKWVSFIQDKAKKYQNFVSKSDKLKILLMQEVQEKNQQTVKIRWVLSDITSLQKQYDQIFICEVGKKFQYSVSVPIRQSPNVAYSLRKFNITSPLQCNFSLVQKDKRIFRKVNYDYSWVRLIIVMKENRGTRWINGKYGTGKCIELGNMWLEAGQYYCLIMVDWKARPYDLILHFNGSQQVIFNRAQINEYPDIVPQLCVDLAQRFGQNTQINKSLCSYRYKDLLNGFIIENYHNQSDRQVFFYRKFGIPSDSQKYKIVGQAITDKNQLEIQIKQDQQRTFILQCQDGLNQDFFGNFVFSIRR